MFLRNSVISSAGVGSGAVMRLFGAELSEVNFKNGKNIYFLNEAQIMGAIFFYNIMNYEENDSLFLSIL